MKTAQTNLWTFPADIRVITTNGTITRAGACVMGRGCALEAKRKWPELPFRLGRLIEEKGNHVHMIQSDHNGFLLSFPVKHEWFQKADIGLITRSVDELLKYTGPKQTVVMPRPGCGNGGLKWDDVEPILATRLDDRYTIVNN